MNELMSSKVNRSRERAGRLQREAHEKRPFGLVLSLHGAWKAETEFTEGLRSLVDAPDTATLGLQWMFVGAPSVSIPVG